MSQSSTRNNFTDILLDPTTIAVVGSIAIHAILAANLAFFNQISKEVKKPDPVPVKVLELTPTELQRIPQAPPVAPPTPSQQVIPPVYQPSTPVPPIAQPIAQPIAPPIVGTALETIPLTPIPTPPPKPKKVTAKSPITKTPPQPKADNQPPKGTKDQKAIPQAQPAPPIFDNPDISFKPTPAATPTAEKSPIVTKPSSSPSSTAPTQKSPSTQKSPITRGGNGSAQGNGSEQGNGKPSQPSVPGQKVDINVPSPGSGIGATPQAPTPQAPTPQAPTSPQPELETSGSENGVQTYGKYTEKANDRLQEYAKLYPGILERSSKPKALTIKYPVGTICPRSPQKSFIVLMVVFGKVTAQDPALGSETTEEQTGKMFVAYDKDTPENKKLGEIAVARALEAASTANQNREQKNKDRELLYQYRVTFDSKSCKTSN